MWQYIFIPAIEFIADSNPKFRIYTGNVWHCFIGQVTLIIEKSISQNKLCIHSTFEKFNTIYIFHFRSYLRRSRQIKTECRPQFTAPSGDCDPHQNYDHPAASQVTPKDILSFAWQISNGMSYLSDVKVCIQLSGDRGWYKNLTAGNIQARLKQNCRD